MISQELISLIISILKRHGIVHASIFGSYARGEEKPESDVDILIEPSKKMTLLSLAAVYCDLEEKLNRRVDLARYNFVRKEFKENIMKDKIDIL